MPTDSQKPLSRKITAEEAIEGYLLVNKTWLRKLPEPGKPFQLKVGNSHLKVQIQRRDTGEKEQFFLVLPLVTLVEGSEATLRPVNDEKVVLELSATA